MAVDTPRAAGREARAKARADDRTAEIALLPRRVLEHPPRARELDGRIGRVTTVVFVILVATAPLWTWSAYRNVVARAAVYGLVALSLNVLVGYAGQVSLGHAAFLGVGAFAAGYAQTEIGAPFLAGLALAAATGAAAAVLLGLVALRVRGLHLALVTLAYALFAQEVVFNIRGLTGGGAGLASPRPELLSGDRAYAAFCLGVLGLAYLADRRLFATRPGRAIRALRDTEPVAASWGIDVTAYKLLAFVLSGILAGLAGGLFASIEGIVVAADFGTTLSLTFLLMAILGGLGSAAGAVQGAILVTILPTVLDVGADRVGLPFDGSVAPLIVALLTVIVLAVFPNGLIALERSALARIDERRRNKEV